MSGIRSPQRQQEIKKTIRGWLNEGLVFIEIRSLLSSEVRAYRDLHKTRRKGPKVHIVHSTTDGQLSALDARRMQKDIDIPFEELSPLAQRLYLDAIATIRLPAPAEPPVKKAKKV